MQRLRILVLVLGIVCAIGASGDAQTKKEPMIGNMVFFSLNDNSPEGVAKFVAGLEKYIGGNPGQVLFHVGTRAKEYSLPSVNELDWDVSLYNIFQTKRDHDNYQGSARHQQFIKEFLPSIKKVRRFDSVIDSQ